MLSFSGFRPDPNTPIYLQIIWYIKQCIVAGTACNGEEIPSRRALSALLGVNPNTVQKAYALLEEEGLIQSHSGAKSCISLTPERTAQVRNELTEGAARAAVQSLSQLGLSWEEAQALLAHYWQQQTRGDTQ